MRKLSLSIAMLLLSVVSSYGQNLPKIIPPGPNAASLAQYVEIPVSHYTGLPNINIPLYSISVGSKINVPISLSYHARGVKVAELSSSYGLGWSLNAGGTVSRQIRGNADESPKGYLNQNYYDTFFTSEATRRVAYAEELSNQFDRTPDQFTFNFGGYTGKFIFDRTTKLPILETFDDLKIVPIGNVSSNIEGFIITTPDGVQYYFGKSSNGKKTAIERNITLENYSYSKEKPITKSLSTSRNDISSWHLLEIIEPYGEQVNFTYEIEDAETYKKTEEVAEPKIGGSGFQRNIYFSKEKINQLKIKKITFKNGLVNFDYNFVRQDLKGYITSIPKALSSIEVLSTNNSTSKRIKKYNFNYTHTESTNNKNVINHLLKNAPEAKKRLFLSRITQEGNNKELLPPYKFTYNSQILPNRFSTSHDKWGYYNGKNNGDFAVFSNFNEIVKTAIDTVKIQAGLLTKVEYPTGGSAEYSYESNRAEFPSHLKNYVSFNQNNPIVEKDVSLEKEIKYYDPKTKTYSIPFTIGKIVESSGVGVGTIFATVPLPYIGCTDKENSNCPYLVRIYKANNTVHAILHNTTSNNNKPQPVSITAGNYILKVISNNPSTEDPNDLLKDFGVVLKWSEVVENESKILYTGGNRIKKTMLKNEEGVAIERVYEYKYLNGKTSGKVFALPPYYSYEETRTTPNGVTRRVISQVNFRPANTLTLEQGNHGGYTYVTEYLGSKEKNIGKREFAYSTPYDEGYYYRIPYHLPNSRERFRGKPTKILDYKKSSTGTYKLVKKTENFYSFNEDEGDTTGRKFKSIKLVVFGARGPILTTQSTIPPNQRHNYYVPFTLDYGVVKLTSSQVTEYFENGKTLNDTYYFYDFDKHYQIKSSSMVNSKGETIIAQTKFAHDLNDQTLINAHRIVEPIEVETTKKVGGVTTKLSKQKTLYKDFGNGLYLPDSIQTSKGLQSLETRIVYHSYDTKGNPTEVSKADGTSIVYIWGYHQTQPIAKIEGVKLSVIPASTITNLQNLSNADNDRTLNASGKEGALRTALNNLRNLAVLKDAQVTTFTYDPLIGVTSITDPRGYVMYYQYDSFNRLEFIKDASGNIVQENKYKYKN